jgi:hypothetical protein
MLARGWTEGRIGAGNRLKTVSPPQLTAAGHSLAEVVLPSCSLECAQRHPGEFLGFGVSGLVRRSPSTQHNPHFALYPGPLVCGQ